MPRDFNSENELLRDFVAPGSPATAAPAAVPSVADVLRAARKLIANQDDWCTGALSRPKDNGGLQHCARGALLKVQGIDWMGEISPAEIFLAEFSETEVSWPFHTVAGRIAGHNNTLGHAATLRMFDRAIAAAEASPCNA